MTGAAIVWILVTRWGAVSHAHPSYPLLIGLTVLGAVAGLWRSARRTASTGPAPRRRRVLRAFGVMLVLAWVALLVWLRPFAAHDTALDAMRSDAQVSVTESATRITLWPTGATKETGVLFQPGARVDARAYAAHLRPLAAAGYPVIIVKQPLGIAFLAADALDDAARDFDDIASWVAAGHSLGGTVAAMEAKDFHASHPDQLAGLILWGSYPAGPVGDLAPGRVLSVSSSQDGLATPAKIDAARADLPADTTFQVIDGGSHAQFGDYGRQPGDGTATISNDQARERISAATLDALDDFGR